MRLFGRKRPPPPPPSDETEMKARAMASAIEQRKAEDPLIGVKIGAKELYARVSTALTGERGIHAETLFGVLGALAGFACVAAIDEQLTRAGTAPGTAGITIVTGKDGRTYWFGDVMNRLLLEDQFSVWSVIAGQAQALGVTRLPDVVEVMGHVAGSVGGEDFARPRLPEGHPLMTMPLDAVRALWPRIRPILLQYCDDPRQWPLLVALAAQEAQRAARDALDPALAATIFAECAFPMAKLAPGSLGAA